MNVATTLVDLAWFTQAIQSPDEPLHSSWQPWHVQLEPGECGRFEAACREQGLTIVDTIERQLADLAVVRLPSTEQAAARAGYVERLVAAHSDRDAYGTWVWFPWEAKVVHVLERDDYFDVITNRNQDKITREEQLRLRGKRVAVIGLSVGGEAAVTVAQEHLCGTIVLADFDRLDLSNLNRLNSGCDDLGQNKAALVARRIAKVNPYLEIRVFADGVSDGNLSSFLDGVDLLIEECDDLRMKHTIRRLAKERGVNVVFAADERGFLSVEPYAHAPELGVFHGRIAHPQPRRQAFTTPLAFMRALTEWMGGWDQISRRSRGSLQRIGEALCGYPQLASEARYAAGQVGHVARRLLLGERVPPFLGHLDPAELVPSGEATNELSRGAQLGHNCQEQHADTRKVSQAARVLVKPNAAR